MGVAISVDDSGGGHAGRAWAARAMQRLEAEQLRAVATPLLHLPLPEFPNIHIYMKDESAHPSGSIKHRLAHALFAHAICNGDIGEGMTVVEASPGATAISLAWFARLLDLPFATVVSPSTPPAKIAALRWAGCEVIKAAPHEDLALAAFRVASERGGHFMNQYARAAEVSDWRGSSTLAESLFAQVISRTGLAPRWVVAGAGTGGTSATLGRFLRYKPHLAETRLCVVDPERSAYFKAYSQSDWSAIGEASRLVDGIGRTRVEASFCPAVVDQMLSIPDAASVAGIHWLGERTGRKFGPSTGTNIVGALLLAHAMERRGETGTIVTLACSKGEAYAETLYAPHWLACEGVDIEPWRDLPRKVAAFTIPDF